MGALLAPKVVKAEPQIESQTINSVPEVELLLDSTAEARWLAILGLSNVSGVMKVKRFLLCWQGFAKEHVEL